jgi:DNA-binding NarL/FixJ family response regulator
MKIVILDDHSLFSQGLGEILKENFEGVDIAIYKSIAKLTQHNIDYNSCDLLISDIELPGEDIFVFLNYVKSNFPKLPILVISMHNKLSVIRRCKELNIEGYILKDDHNLIIKVVNELTNGGDYYSPKVLKTLDILKIKENLLTPKEEQIIALLASGKSNQEIADELFISYNTIKTHRKNISRKLQLSTVADLIKYYYENYL